MKNQADIQYKRVIETILKDGVDDFEQNVRTVWKDGVPAHTISTIAQSMRFDNSEVPLLTTKRVAWKTAIKELLWIWQKKSNRVQDLRDMGVNIWNEWEQEDGTIGKAYGYQLGKKNRKVLNDDILWDMYKDGSISSLSIGNEDGRPSLYAFIDQVDYLIYQLKTNPASRRHITMLWNPDDLDDMSLTPCVYETQWHVKKGKLHLEVRCRSNDMPLGNPFNVFQYNVLQRMIAQVVGLELGEYIFHIGDAHVYDRHINNIEEQISRESFEAPKLLINQFVTSFYDFKIEDFELLDYEYGEKVYFEIAI